LYNADRTDPVTGKTLYGFQIRQSDYQSNFYSCFQNKIVALDPTKFKLDLSVFNILQGIEEAFKCNGLCDFGNFFFFVDVSEGPPSNTCKNSLNTIFSNISLNVGIVLAVSFLLLSATFIIQYWFICCRKSLDDVNTARPV